MHKHILTTAFVLVIAVTLIGAPLTAFSADEVSFTAGTLVFFSGTGISIWVLSGSLADSMTVETTYVTFTLSANSNVVIQSNERRMFTVSGISASTDCNITGHSKLTLSGQSTTTTATVTPSDTICGTPAGSGGSGGGGVSTTTPSVPTTTTGQVTVTASTGGKTTLTTSDNTIATAELAANAVSSSTDVKIAADNKATAVASRPIPSGKSIVGNYAYSYTATANSQTVSTFLKNITLTFSYTDSQISGLNEDTLRVYYWDGTQWLVLSSDVDKINNKVIATTNHFTYFVVMGETAAMTTMAKPEDYGLKEGNLIRATGDFDIFIINQSGYKRLFLNPAIFNMYGHLGGWEAVKSVAPSTRDAFITSTHYRYVDSPKVYHQEVTGEDTGILHWVNMTAENFLVQGGTANAIFTINKSELDWYQKGTELTSL